MQFLGNINSMPLNTSIINKMYAVLQDPFEGAVVTFNKEVERTTSFEGAVVTFNKEVQRDFEGACISFHKRIVEETNKFELTGYEVNIYIGGNLIPQFRLCDTYTRTKGEGNTTTMEFSIIPPSGVQDLDYYLGKSVQVYIRTNSGYYKSFTGYINTPTADLINEKISFNCSDRRTNRILTEDLRSATFPGIQNVGSYSNTLFGDAKDPSDELDKRLSLIPYSFDFDNNGNPQLTAWSPKAVADFTFNGTPGVYYDNKVYYDKPSVTYADRTSTINTVEISFEHNYTRLHQQTIVGIWTGYDQFVRDWWNNGRPSFMSKDAIEGAATAGGWNIIGSINFVELWDSQGFGSVVWQPNGFSSYTRTAQRITGYKRGDDGALTLINDKPVPIYTDVKDSSGRIVTETYRTELNDTSSGLCRGAAWRSARKFSQNVVENYTLNIVDPVGLARFGPVVEQLNFNLTSPFDASVYENDPTVFNTDVNIFSNQKTSVVELNNAVYTALNLAKNKILQAHRDVVVSLRRSIFPQIDLMHTVAVNINPVQCRGKVVSIVDTINFNTNEAFTDLKLKLSRSPSAVSNSTLAMPSAPSEDLSYIGESLPGFVGGGTTNADYYARYYNAERRATISGAIVNFFPTETTINTFTTPVKTTAPESFVVKYPAIADVLRRDRILSSTTSYNVNIPNDYLVVTFNVLNNP